jgi:hypothetical protein
MGTSSEMWEPFFFVGIMGKYGKCPVELWENIRRNYGKKSSELWEPTENLFRCINKTEKILSFIKPREKNVQCKLSKIIFFAILDLQFLTCNA